MTRALVYCVLFGTLTMLFTACDDRDERDFYDSEVCQQRTWGICGAKNRERGAILTREQE